MRIPLLILCLLPFCAISQTSIDFEDSDINAWSQYPENRWSIISEDPISGAYSLKHNYDNSSSFIDQIALPIDGTLDFNNQTICWQFKLKYAYNPSSGNNWAIYLISNENVPRLHEDSISNAYILGMNLTNSDDTLCLYKKNGANTSIITKTSCNWQQDIGKTTIVAIQILREKDGNWEISLSKEANLNTLIKIGEFTDLEYTFSDHFGISYRYTSSADRNLWFDDLYIGELIQDTVPPHIDTCNVSKNYINVLFSEALDSASCFDNNNYLIPELGQPDSISQESPNSILLHYLGGIPNGLISKIYATNICDLSSNCMELDSCSFWFYEHQKYDIVINELMADPNPAVNLPEEEYLEIFNTSNFPIDISNWIIEINEKQRVIPECKIEPSNYLILGSSSAASALSSYGNTLSISSFPAITNSGATIKLIDTAGIVISSISFSADWYNDKEKTEGGWSIERRNPWNNCSTSENWTASHNESGGSPGSENSVFSGFTDTISPTIANFSLKHSNGLTLSFTEAIKEVYLNDTSNYTLNLDLGNPLSINKIDEHNIELYFTESFPINNHIILTIDSLVDLCGNISLNSHIEFDYYKAGENDIVINEIMADPNPTVALPEEEYIEIFNATDHPLDISNWIIEVNSKQAKLPDYTIDSGEYLILGNPEINSIFNKFGNCLAISSFPSITNSGATINLIDTSGLIISSVSFSADWYHDEEKAEGGWSLERRNPWNNCSTSENWIESDNESGGSPGSENSAFSNFTDNIAPEVTELKIISNFEIQLIFSEPIDSNCTGINNFRIENLKLDSIISNERLTQINLILTGSLESGKIYNLTITELLDVCENSRKDINLEFEYYSPKLFDITISEIMIDPTPEIGLPPYEYIELYNHSGHTINIENWLLYAGKDIEKIENGTILPEEYIILCDEDAINSLEEFGKCIPVKSFPGLSNSSEEISILDNNNNLMHTLKYSSEWYKDEFKEDGGWSLEAIDLENFCGEGNNWIASNDKSGGTPGKLNSVLSSNPDEINPFVTHVGYTGDSVLTLHFSENILTNNLNATFFEVKPEIGSPSKIIVDGEIKKQAHLGFSKPFDNQKIYTLEINGDLCDCSKNILQTQSIQFGIPEETIKGDLVINEILFNPPSNGSDYIELYNNSSKTIDLSQIIIANKKDGEIHDFTYLSEYNYLILPGEYLVISEDIEFVKGYYYSDPDAQYLELSSLPSYPDDEGIVVLLNKNQETLDLFEYNDDMHSKMLVSDEGVSLERKNFNFETNDANNWQSAAETVGFATPGYLNSQYSDQTESLTQITKESEVFSPDNDGYQDEFIIHYNLETTGNTINIKIFNKQGQIIKTLSNNTLIGTNGILSWDGYTDQGQMASPGIYLVYVELINENGEVKSFKESCVLVRE